MRNALHAPLLAALLASVVSASEAWADDGVLPASIIASTTTGFWQDTGREQPAPAVTLPSTDASTTVTPPSRHGFYKLYAVRQADRTSKVYLQQVATTDDGPQILSTTELPEITALKAIVTDIRPENSGGIIREPGLFATLYIKTDADADADVWNVMLDELGEIVVEKAPE